MKFNDYLTIAGCVIFFTGFLILIYGIDTGYIVNFQSMLLETMVQKTANTGTLGSIGILLGTFARIITGLVFLTVSLVFLIVHGALKGDKKTSIIAGLICGTLALSLFRFSPVSLCIFAGIILISLYINPLSNTYFQELRKWKYFRTGSHAVSRALMIFSLFLALGIFISVYTGNYGEIYINTLSETIANSAIDYKTLEKTIDEQYPGIPAEQKQAVINDFAVKTKAMAIENMKNSPIFNAYIRWLPVLSAVTVWFILELIKSLVLVNIGGAVSSVLTRVYIRILQK